MTTDEFFSIASMFASEDVTRPLLCKPFKLGEHFFATDGACALVCDAVGLEAANIAETIDHKQRACGESLGRYIDECQEKIDAGRYELYDTRRLVDAVCAAFADIEPEMMALRMATQDDCDDAPDSVRGVHMRYAGVIMPNSARSFLSGYYASLVIGLADNFAPVKAYADKKDPETVHIFRGVNWDFLVLPRRVSGCGLITIEDIYNSVAIADAKTGELVRARGVYGPSLDELRKIGN